MNKICWFTGRFKYLRFSFPLVIPDIGADDIGADDVCPDLEPHACPDAGGKEATDGPGGGVVGRAFGLDSGG